MLFLFVLCDLPYRYLRIFFFQAEDGIRDHCVTGVQTCALPIYALSRALQNFVETFPLFAASVLIAHLAATHSWMTEWGVQLYFWGRVAYLALYAAGVFLLRSLAWNVAALGIVLVLLSLV